MPSAGSESGPSRTSPAKTRRAPKVKVRGSSPLEAGVGEVAVAAGEAATSRSCSSNNNISSSTCSSSHSNNRTAIRATKERRKINSPTNSLSPSPPTSPSLSPTL